MPDPSLDKNRLRSELRRRRRQLTGAEQTKAAAEVARQATALTAWPGARCLALYLAADGEVDTHPLASRCRAAGKQLFLPVIRDGEGRLDFALWEEGAALVPNRYGIPEPPPTALRRGAGELDIIFLPLVGWDRGGGRLGMGGGFYDRSLADVHGPLLVGLAHGCQEVEQVPRSDWDVPLDFIATETALYRGALCRSREAR